MTAATEIDTIYGALLQGDKGAEKRLFETLTVRLRVIAYLHTGSREDAEEVVQEALLVIAQQHRSVEFRKSFASWAHKVLLNRLKAHFRKRQKQTKLFGAAEGKIQPLAWTPNLTLEEGIASCLKELKEVSPRYAEVLLLSYKGFEQVEISDKLGISRENLYVILHRARTRLKTCLAKKGLL